LLVSPSVNVTTDNETGGTKMFSINRICLAGAVVSMIAAVLMASGCGVSGGMQRAGEVRVATRLEAGSPKVMVNGPARLLHVDVHGRGSLNVYSVKRAADGSANCANAARSDVHPLRQGASNELNLAVHADEAVCLANTNDADAAPRGADVSWHARRGSDEPVQTADTDRPSSL